jgi:hypothetical protein
MSGMWLTKLGGEGELYDQLMSTKIFTLLAMSSKNG